MQNVDSRMSHSVAKHAAIHVRQLHVVHVNSSQQHAQHVAEKQEFHLSQNLIVLFIAANALQK